MASYPSRVSVPSTCCVLGAVRNAGVTLTWLRIPGTCHGGERRRGKDKMRAMLDKVAEE